MKASYSSTPKLLNISEVRIEPSVNFVKMERQKKSRKYLLKRPTIKREVLESSTQKSKREEKKQSINPYTPWESFLNEDSIQTIIN